MKSIRHLLSFNRVLPLILLVVSIFVIYPSIGSAFVTTDMWIDDLYGGLQASQSASIGDVIEYKWKAGPGVTSVSAKLLIYKNGTRVFQDACGNMEGFFPWVSGLSGSFSGRIADCQAGYEYGIQLNSTDANGQVFTHIAATVNVLPIRLNFSINDQTRFLRIGPNMPANYSWNVGPAEQIASVTSSLSIDTPDNGVSDNCGNTSTDNFSLRGLTGYLPGTIAACQAGFTYNITLHVTTTSGAAYSRAISVIVSGAQGIPLGFLGKIPSQNPSGSRPIPRFVDPGSQAELGPLASPAVFNAADYRARYADLQNVFAADDEVGLTQHWVKWGAAEGRQGNQIFNSKTYLDTYADIKKAYGANNYAGATFHFAVFGFNERRAGVIQTRPEVFNPEQYRARYGDLINAFAPNDRLGLSTHWVMWGIGEGRRGSDYFSPAIYLSRYPDLTAAFGPTNYYWAVIHYITWGIQEGRTGG